MSKDTVYNQALKLTGEEREELALRLLDTVDRRGVVEHEEWQQTWLAEIKRRLADLDAKKVVLVPADQVLAEARQRIDQAR